MQVLFELKKHGNQLQPRPGLVALVRPFRTLHLRRVQGPQSATQETLKNAMYRVTLLRGHFSRQGDEVVGH